MDINSTTTEAIEPQSIELINETYVDGAATVSIRQRVAKIDFYQASPVAGEEGSTEQKEFRKISHRLVLPVSGLQELHGMLSEIVKEIDERRKA